MEACNITKHGRHLGHHLGFYQEFKKTVKTARIEVEVLRFAGYVLLKSLKQVPKNMHFHSKMG